MCCSSGNQNGCRCMPEGVNCNCGSKEAQNYTPCACQGYGLRLEGFIIPCLLALLKQSPAHGYQLYEKLSEFPFLKQLPDPSVIYRQLRNMKSDGLVKSKLSPGRGGPARTVYSLTEYGEEYLLSCITSLKGIRCMIDNFLVDFSQD